MTASKVGLHAVSIWFNPCCFALPPRADETRTKADVYREFVIVRTISFGMTNLLREWPWFVSSKFLFTDLHTIEDWLGLTDRIREHMWLWPLASLGSVDLNGNGTFMSIEMLPIPSILTFTAFYLLDTRGRRLRYVLPIFNGPMVVGGTLMFSYSEVFGGYANMPGGVADTRVALL